MLQSWETGGKTLVAGNGGSAADAMHLAEELIARFMKNRRALAAIALCDPTAITCAANDFGFENIFSRQVEALGNANDVLIVFTTSGNSANILRAIEQANEKKLTTAAFSAKTAARRAASATSNSSSPRTSRIAFRKGTRFCITRCANGWMRKLINPRCIAAKAKMKVRSSPAAATAWYEQ
jgi:D-sedoheptulose 7-phosphate isomerase